MTRSTTIKRPQVVDVRYETDIIVALTPDQEATFDKGQNSTLPYRMPRNAFNAEQSDETVRCVLR
jgi:hypothetical protein